LQQPNMLEPTAPQITSTACIEEVSPRAQAAHAYSKAHIQWNTCAARNTAPAASHQLLLMLLLQPVANCCSCCCRWGGSCSTTRRNSCSTRIPSLPVFLHTSHARLNSLRSLSHPSATSTDSSRQHVGGSMCAVHRVSLGSRRWHATQCLLATRTPTSSGRCRSLWHKGTCPQLSRMPLFNGLSSQHNMYHDAAWVTTTYKAQLRHCHALFCLIGPCTGLRNTHWQMPAPKLH
jgi:hypothetical protein